MLEIIAASLILALTIVLSVITLVRKDEEKHKSFHPPTPIQRKHWVKRARRCTHKRHTRPRRARPMRA